MVIPTAFISYSHDSPKHKEWVRHFATGLRHRRIDAILDQWELQLGADIPSFMEKHLSTADRVLMICTPKYVEKANAGTGGVGYEKMIVTADMMQSIDSARVIPVVRRASAPLVPTFLRSKLYIDFSNDDEMDARLDELACALRTPPGATKPPLGPERPPAVPDRIPRLDKRRVLSELRTDPPLDELARALRTSPGATQSPLSLDLPSVVPARIPRIASRRELFNSRLERQEATRFMSKEDVCNVVTSRLGKLADLEPRALLLYKNPTQKTWIVATSLHLTCLVDDIQKGSPYDPVRWSERYANVLPIEVERRASDRGFVHFGSRHHGWYYSPQLHPDAKKLEKRLEKLLYA